MSTAFCPGIASLTPAQQEAIVARGNVLVVAGAGTGKTRTLVERCLNCLLNEKPRLSLDEIFMVTFTEAAAAEMRQRIRDRLEEERRRHGEDTRWEEQLALFDTAHIGTLHSFCLQLVRQHFYQLELDPQLSVLPQEEARLLADETLDHLFQRHYAGRCSNAQAVQQLIQTQGRGWDKPIRGLVWRLHHYAQSLPNPTGWVEGQLALFAAPEPLTWRLWLLDAVVDWRKQWFATLETLSTSNKLAARCAGVLLKIPPSASPNDLVAAFGEITLARKNFPRGKKALWFEPLEGFLDDADFLSSLLCAPGSPDPLVEDWAWVRDPMSTLLELAREFSRSFNEAKRELGVVDFQDLEQYALRLLWDHATNRPTDIARRWRNKLRFLFVDEYQDINAAQDQIVLALGREGGQANRFLVGDVKQSIYRFRLANPAIFRGYAEQWARGDGSAIPLVENFRSREGLLNFINSVFSLLMHRELGGIEYDPGAALRFGAHRDRGRLSVAANPIPCVELHLRLKGSNGSPNEDSSESLEGLGEVVDLQEADKEARLVALRLRELRAQRHPVWDVQTSQFRPVDWHDMAILLRSPAKKAESYAKEFARLDLPLQVARGGFYRSLEISDLLSLLALLDNPLQDLPALAVLHSPLVGLTANELAEIRLTLPKARFWTALTGWHRNQGAKSASSAQPLNGRPEEAGSSPCAGPPRSTFAGPVTYRTVTTFLDRFARWRRLARQISLSRCLETVLAETHYASWLLTQPRGTQRHANVQRLVTLAQEFDQFQRQGLFRFLKFIEDQQAAETEPDVAAASQENAVRLMSIHQSKGLEFPLVVVADLGKPFNLADLSAEIILDEQYGLCPQIKPPHTGKRYPSLSYWLARRRQRHELLGEELRLLYVAMTRARDALILSGSLPHDKLSQFWLQPSRADTATLSAARSYIDWIGLWFSLNVGDAAKDKLHGETALLRWFLHDDSELVMPDSQTQRVQAPETSTITVGSGTWRQLEQRLSWQYPFTAATREPAKTSVSALRRQAETDGDDAATLLAPEERSSRAKARTQRAKASPGSVGFSSTRLTAAEVGNAHHQFLQLVAVERTHSVAALGEEANRLMQEGRLAPEQLAVLDYEALTRFWNSDLGARIRNRQRFIHRELAFTTRFSPTELAALLGQPRDPSLESELVLVQGVVDLAVVAPQEIWLVDFKTDQLQPIELASRLKVYEPQVRLYAEALSQIYRRPVSETWLYFLGLKQAVAVARVNLSP